MLRFEFCFRILESRYNNAGYNKLWYLMNQQGGKKNNLRFTYLHAFEYNKINWNENNFIWSVARSFTFIHRIESGFFEKNLLLISLVYFWLFSDIEVLVWWFLCELVLDVGYGLPIKKYFHSS